MRASNFEFRYRFFVIGAVFSIGFSLYALDRASAGARLGGWLAGPTALSKHLLVRLIFAFGALAAVLAAAIRTWASAYLNSAIVHDTALHSEKLVADGPYRYVRNPLYLGTILLALGMGLMSNRWGFLEMVAGMVFVTYRLILREESQLRSSQGESYLRYLKTVPRLLPSILPRLAASEAKPDWPQAFFGELFLWGLAAGTVLFAATLKIQFWYIPVAVSMALYAFSILLLKRKQKARGA